MDIFEQALWVEWQSEWLVSTTLYAMQLELDRNEAMQRYVRDALWAQAAMTLPAGKYSRTTLLYIYKFCMFHVLLIILQVCSRHCSSLCDVGNVAGANTACRI